MAPIIMFRDPISRVVSHFHFAKTLEWTKGLKIRQQSLSEYLSDRDSMLITNDIWIDGQVSLKENDNMILKNHVILTEYLSKLEIDPY